MQASFNYIKHQLDGLYPDNEIKSFSYLIMEEVTGWTRSQIILNKNTIFSAEQQQVIESFVNKLRIFIPIQYILGKTEFYELTITVNESVLIPRPETEELVEWICAEAKDIKDLKVLDIGTGSGCIALAVKSVLSKAQVDAYDISPDALEVAKTNAVLNQLSVQFSAVDILHSAGCTGEWNVIVSNPPYIPEEEKQSIHANVLENEPHLALFVPDNDPLLFYREIAVFGLKHLIRPGKLFFEIHRDFGQQTCDLLLSLGYSNVQLRKDIFGNDRMIYAQLIV